MYGCRKTYIILGVTCLISLLIASYSLYYIQETQPEIVRRYEASQKEVGRIVDVGPMKYLRLRFFVILG